MEEALTIKQAAKRLNLSYSTVYQQRLNWGFFRMNGSSVWRIYPSELDRNRQEMQNTSRLGVLVGDKEKKCRSEKTKMASGKLISPHRTASEFDAVVKRLTKNSHNKCTTS